jgi:hypothetical protein
MLIAVLVIAGLVFGGVLLALLILWLIERAWSREDD